MLTGTLTTQLLTAFQFFEQLLTIFDNFFNNFFSFFFLGLNETQKKESITSTVNISLLRIYQNQGRCMPSLSGFPLRTVRYQCQ